MFMSMASQTYNITFSMVSGSVKNYKVMMIIVIFYLKLKKVQNVYDHFKDKNDTKRLVLGFFVQLDGSKDTAQVHT